MYPMTAQRDLKDSEGVGSAGTVTPVATTPGGSSFKFNPNASSFTFNPKAPVFTPPAFKSSVPPSINTTTAPVVFNKNLEDTALDYDEGVRVRVR